ncbi:proline dehydrogenase family protein [Nocardia seriolae]|uniref:proline dehydrogenase n=1 Tax=Nocardia seriolae TaxID=37332 RepID=A0A0B8NAJ3_9NOCA|nr:proline dehydrogenase family protein [Nocardia seriolae]APA98747.1 Proline dehydrogenase [Nocardia seriolae]MTJ63821.1 proline dehydrogenase [Nocardia seriolae]MTJ72282.1 proline dehydrogenase [Nocardia seriolae]MTJ88381.1 proline dehydrogenase [Nocardia seriolae]MTK32366.1 proline dehydrogenase [Nocardia seriolae]
MFTTTLRPALLAASRSARVERTVTGLSSTRKVVARFVAGETEAHAAAATTALLDSGRYASIDYLGEDTTEIAQARSTVSHYLTLLEALGELPAAAGEVRPLEVSLKLSALGQSLPRDGHAIALEHAHKICTAAAAAGVWVTVDAEDHTTTDSTLAVVRALRADFSWVGTVLQAYLLRTEGDCRDLSGPGSRIRLCKGAYREPEGVAYQARDEVDASYLRCLDILMRGQGYPMVATHDPVMLDAATGYLRSGRRTADRFEFQMLYGIRDDEQRRLVGTGAHLRTYVPYGDQWYGYFMRRLAERPANLAFFLRSFRPGARG